MPEHDAEQEFELEKARIAAGVEKEKARFDADARVREARWGFWKTVITTGVLGTIAAVATTLINASITKRERDLEYLQANSELVASYVDQALNEEISVRILLAEYFAHISPDQAFRDLWSNYLDILEKAKRDQLALMTRANSRLIESRGIPLQAFL